MRDHTGRARGRREENETRRDVTRRGRRLYNATLLWKKKAAFGKSKEEEREREREGESLEARRASYARIARKNYLRHSSRARARARVVHRRYNMPDSNPCIRNARVSPFRGDPPSLLGIYAPAATRARARARHRHRRRSRSASLRMPSRHDGGAARHTRERGNFITRYI